MLLPLFLLACFDLPIRQAGHKLTLEESKTRSLAYGTRHSVDVILDGQSLEVNLEPLPVSPPVSRSGRIYYWGKGLSAESWDDTWYCFALFPADAAQHDAMKAVLDSGTGKLYDRLTDTKAYKWSYARECLVLWEAKAKDQEFLSPTEDRLSITSAGAVFMDGALIGNLERTGTMASGIDVRLDPHTFGSGPAEIRVEPKTTDPRAYVHQGTGQGLFVYYGWEATERGSRSQRKPRKPRK